MWLNVKKLKAVEKIKKFFLGLPKKVNLSILIRPFSVVALDYDKILSRLHTWFDDNDISNSTLFLSCVVLFAVVISLMSVLWALFILLS